MYINYIFFFFVNKLSWREGDYELGTLGHMSSYIRWMKEGWYDVSRSGSCWPCCLYDLASETCAPRTVTLRYQDRILHRTVTRCNFIRRLLYVTEFNVHYRRGSSSSRAGIPREFFVRPHFKRIIHYISQIESCNLFYYSTGVGGEYYKFHINGSVKNNLIQSPRQTPRRQPPRR